MATHNSTPKDTGVLGLSAIRQKRGITLATISNSTKISVRSLQAIESGEFKKLPGGIYSTSYIRQYARAIDFDESELLAFYNSKMGIVPELELSNAAPAEPERSSIVKFLRHPAALVGL
jgi:cytoskeletal protein RodZ